MPKETLDDTKLQHVKSAINKIETARQEAASKDESPEPEPPVVGEPGEDTAPMEEDDTDLSPVLDAMADNMRKVQETLLNKENQEAVKKLCKPLSIPEMLQIGEFRQVVPIVKGEFEVEFRSISADEDMALKKIMSDMEYVSERYFMDLYSLYQQTMGVVSIQGARLPSHLDKDNKLDKGLLNAKLEYVLTMPLQMTATVGIHYWWFDQRVKELFDIKRTIGEIKNG
jgi:hypothetical protein